MKITAPNRKIKNKARTLAEFKSIVKNARFKANAVVTLCDKNRSVTSEQMRIGTYIEAYALCSEYGIRMISYQAVYDKPPKKSILLTKDEYDAI